jgi:hypothetical protein
MAKLLLAFLSCSLLACLGCGESDELIESESGSVIIGSNDLLPVSANGDNVAARYRGLLDGFGRMLIPSGGGYALCTATHLGNGVAISAGHCVGAPATRVNNQPCPGVQVEWGLRTGKGATLRSNCTTILAMELNSAHDYMIFRVDQAPPAAVGFDTAIPPAGTPLTIFSHPGGRPLEWSRTCSVINRGGDQFGYQCDTQGGSSGASVLRDDTLRVVGIHWGGGGNQNIATYLGRTATDALGGGGGGVNVRSGINAGFCWDVSGASTTNGAAVILWGCHSGANQKWQATAGQLRVYGNKCLDVPSGNDVNGAKLQIWDCQSGNGNQQFVREGQLWRWAGHNKCVDLTEGVVAGGTPLQLWECNAGNANQKWQ